LIIGLGKACEIILEDFNTIIARLLEKRKEIEKYYLDNSIGTNNFKEVKRAPHILSITLNDFNAEEQQSEDTTVVKQYGPESTNKML
jgi:cysteine desulfurase